MKRQPLATMARACGWATCALWATAAAAQLADDRARLDDFAVPQPAQTARIDQLSPAAAPIPPVSQPHDRSLAVPERTGSSSEMPRQVSQQDDNRRTVQVSNPDQSRNRTVSVSSTAESGPGGVVRLGGKDRCDPQLDKRQLAECLRILELRADEFNAPAPPQLSAEQKLLIEQRMRDEELADRSASFRIRLATMAEPDADLTSNQELASIYLDNLPGAAPPPPEPQAPPVPADLGEALKGLGIDPGTPPPDGF
jgi:hypothetical protein